MITATKVLFVPSSYTSYEGISGIVLKESSEIVFADFCCFPLTPRIAIRVLLSTVNLNRVLMWFITFEYCLITVEEKAQIISLHLLPFARLLLGNGHYYLFKTLHGELVDCFALGILFYFIYYR